ncbi:MAG: DNA polymerase-3 subunit beta [Saprospiraceae bacterium]|jgi:DNA polymerase-3 subunit beta
MKFSVSSSELLKKLSMSNGVVGANTVMPILEDYLFSLKGDVLTITASNLETTIITTIEVSAEEDGEIAITAKILLDTLKALPEQPITFDVDEGARSISISSAYGKYKLAGDSADDFPDLPEADNTQVIQLSSNILTQALTKTLFATSNDELRAAMQGVYMQIEESSIIFVATDAHKLVKYTFTTAKNDKVDTFIIPKKGLSLLKNALKEDEVELSYNTKNAFFAFGDTQVMIRLIDAKYPDYNAVIPYDNANLLTLDRAEFQSSLKRIAIYANKSTNQVVLNISDGSLTISAQDLDFSNEATEQMTCEYTGDPMNIGFNAKFLGEMLNVIQTDQINLKLSTPNRAGILVPGEQPEDEDLLMLVMPVMLGN